MSIDVLSRASIALLALLGFAACGESGSSDTSPAQVFVGARLIDGQGGAPIERSVLVVQDGRIRAVGAEGAVELPRGAERIDLSGRTIIPGLINSHGHVGDVVGLQAGRYSRENVLDQLRRYARYGITTVVSLGDDQEEGARVRDEEAASALDRSRLLVAGPVLNPRTREEAAEQVARIAEMGADWAKIRIDSSLGQAPKMAPEVYQVVIEEAHRHGLPLAVHIVELEDAKGAVRAGADLVAHSVRDRPVDDELIGLMRERGVCLTPTLTREVSTFVYASRPDFFDDPYFLREADPAVLEELLDPERQRRTRESSAARYWREQLPVAAQNLALLKEAGVGIAMGTDSGPAGRFQGYFEHLEMEMMAEAGMTPMQILSSATGDAARCMGLDADLGTLEPGKHADFLVLAENPLEDIRHTRSIESVWIAGNRVPQS